MSSIDVVVPCYNYGRFLRECVTSVLTQQGVDVRVLIIDDCSNDESVVVGRALAAEDSRVEFRRHDANCGHIATYNEGLLEWASAEYSLLLSADDMLTQGALARAARLMDEHREVGLTYGRVIKTAHPEQHPTPIYDTREFELIDGLTFLRRFCTTADNLVSTPTAVVRTALQRVLGGYRPELPHSGDMEMWLRFGAHASVGVVHAPQAYYRVHRQSMSSGHAGIADLRARRDAFEVLFREHGHLLPDGEEMRATAYRSLAELCFWTASSLFDEGKRDQYVEYLKLAVQLDLGITRAGAWSRFRLKRMIGQTAWSKARPLLRRLRSRIGATSASA
ncbi:MAG TPA: glycosyltransferase family A protein [Tepidisphaeraceae bacterium]|jgi:hypothetical protein